MPGACRRRSPPRSAHGGDKLAAIDECDPGVGQEQVTAGRHREPRDRPLKKCHHQPTAIRPKTRLRVPQAGQHPRQDHLRQVVRQRTGQGGLQDLCGGLGTVGQPRRFPMAGGCGRTAPGSARFLRRHPHPPAGLPSRRRATRALRSRQARQAGRVYRFGSRSGRRASPRSIKHRVSQKAAEPKNSQRKAIQGLRRLVTDETHIIPGARREEEEQIEGCRTLQIRLNLKKIVKHPSRVRKEPAPRGRPQGRRPANRSRDLLSDWITSIRREGDRLAGQLAEGVHRRTLLGVFLVPPPRGSVALPADLRRDLEAFRVVGALLVEACTCIPESRRTAVAATCWRLLL